MVTQTDIFRATADINRLVGQVGLQGLDTIAVAAVRDAAGDAALNAAAEVAGTIELFAETLGSFYRNRTGTIRGIHEQAGKLAQQAMIASYQATVGARSGARGAGPATSRRFSNGAMLSALQDSGHVVATPLGVSFVDQSILDSRARQWARLNFGAGGRGAKSGRPPSATIKLFGQTAGSLSLSHIGPRAAFGMPAGFWLGGGGANPGGPKRGRRGKDQFLSLGAAKEAGFSRRSAENPEGFAVFSGRKLTAGIAASHFIDTGMTVLATELGAGWSTLATAWITEAAARKGTGSGPVSRIQTTPQTIVAASKVAKANLDSTRDDVQRYEAFINSIRIGG